MYRTPSRTKRETEKKAAPVKNIVSVPCAKGRKNFVKDETTNHDETAVSSDYSSSPQDSASSEDEQLSEEDEKKTSDSTEYCSSRSSQLEKKNRPSLKAPEQQLKTTEKMAAKFLVEKDGCDKAIRELTRAMALTRIIYGDKHWKLAASYVALAQAYLEQKDYFVQAEYHAERARSLMSSVVSDLPESEKEKLQIYSTFLKMHHILAVVNVALKKYPQSEKDLARAENILEKMEKFPSYSDVDHDLWKIRLTLASARLSGKQKKFAVSSEKYEEATELMERIHGKETLHLIPVYQEWAKMEQSRGKNANHDWAIDVLQRAHSVATANYKDGDEELINTTLSLAQAYAKMANKETSLSAESYLTQCLVSCTDTYGNEHPKTLAVQDELARILIHNNRRQEALKLLRSNVSVKCHVFGDYSSAVAESLTLIAALHLANGELEPAMKTYQKCLDIYSLMFGTKHQKTLGIQRNIDILKANPVVAAKLSKKDDLKSRPRFT